MVRFVKTGILPLPFTGFTFEIPAGTTACHANVTFGVVEFNATATVFVPLHIDWFATANVVTGAGLTVIEYVPVVPLQLFAVGVTV